ncbi:MAG: cell division protein FtsH, partial [Phycisphaerae bacterium]
EELFCDDISSGAQADIQQATRIARQMIVTWGMSEKLGLISYEGDGGLSQMMYGWPGDKDYSDKTAEEIDAEIKRVTGEAYKNAKELIEANRDKLENIAKALLKYETLDADDVKMILEGKQLDKPTVSDLLAVEQAKTNPNNDKPKQDEQKSQD